MAAWTLSYSVEPTTNLLRDRHCPVWTTTAGRRPRHERVVAAVDPDPWREDDTGKDLDRHILEPACPVAIAESVELHAVHARTSISDGVVRLFSSELSADQIAANMARERRDVQDSLEHLAQMLRAWTGGDACDLLAPRMHLEQGNPRVAIPQCARRPQADLPVVGTLNRVGIAASS